MGAPNVGAGLVPAQTTSVMSGDHSEQEPPEPISNSEVKPLRADDSVGYAHVKVGHRQAPFCKGSL